jgi:hypothetical protein
MRVIEILNEYLNLNLEIDSFSKINDDYFDAEFEYYQLRNTVFDFDYKQKKFYILQVLNRLVLF